MVLSEPQQALEREMTGNHDVREHTQFGEELRILERLDDA
jgi:hypothetical protein